MIFIATCSVIFFLCYAAIVVFMLAGMKKMRSEVVIQSDELVAVVIAARNEAYSIERCIRSVCSQSHTNIEVFVVDDSSSDDTLAIIKRLALHDQRIKVISLGHSDVPQKKIAIEKVAGITNASVMITTDADCMHHTNWISSMLHVYHKGYDMVCGPVRILSATPWDRVQALEFAGLIGVTSCAIENGSPVMCNGANLLYSREAFLRAGGYGSNSQVASGDDVFLMQEMHRNSPGSVAFCHHRDAVVSTFGCPDLSSFVAQRVRWISKIKYTVFSATAAFIGITVVGLNVILPALAALFIFSDNFALLFFSILVGKIFLDGLFLYASANKLEQKSLLWLLPFFEILYLPYLLMLALGTMKRNYYWKNREVRI